MNPRLEASAVMNWWEVQWRFGQVLHPVLGGLSEPLLLTRLDDDDAFAATAMQRVQAAAAGNPDPEPVVWTFPQGLLVWHTPPVPVEIQRFWHPLIGFSTFQVPAGSRLHPYSYGHNQVHHYLPVRVVDEEVGWALFRHDDNMSLLSRREARQAGRVEGTGGAAGIEMVFGETVSLPEALRGGLLDGFPLDWGRWQ